MRTNSRFIHRFLASVALLMALALPASAQRGRHPAPIPPPSRTPSPTRPAPIPKPQFPDEYRPIDEVGNNPIHPEWGTVGEIYFRGTTEQYQDDVEEPSGPDRPNARVVSNMVFDQADDKPTASRVNDLFVMWSQFIDHQIDLTPTAEPEEPFDIQIPTGDVWFDPDSTGTMTMALNRSGYIYSDDGVRQQLNSITSYIDGSAVYGSDDARATALRTNDGTGKLKTSDGDLLPFNLDGLDNAGGTSPFLLVAGDIRVNDQVGLMSMQTVMLREHNWWCDRIAADHPGLSGDDIYQQARAMVIAEIQAVTYNEFLPLLLGRNAIPPYRGYNPRVNVNIWNSFATAAYRFGHSMVSSTLLRLNADGSVIDQGNLDLVDAFFNIPAYVETGIDPVMRGMAAQVAQENDAYIVDALRNFLFGPPGAGGFDLGTLDVQRGRDHGLGTYNQTRHDFHLRPVQSFAQLTSDPDVQTRLEAAYGTIDQLDLFTGCLVENHVRGALVGELTRAILAGQFRRLRDGDRFWYQNYLPRDLAQQVDNTTLSDIIKRNSGIGDELSGNAFVVGPPPAPAPPARVGRPAPPPHRR